MIFIYQWLYHHPGLDIKIHYPVGNEGILMFTMIERYNNHNNVTFTVDIVYYSHLSVDDDYRFIFDSMYDELMAKNAIGTTEG